MEYNKRRWYSFFLIVILIFIGIGTKLQLMKIVKAEKNVETEKSLEMDRKDNKEKEEKKKRKKKKSREKKEIVQEIKVNPIISIPMERSEDAVTTSYYKDQELQELLNSGKYTEKKPYIEVNPFKTSPLTAIILFETKEKYAIRVTVCGKRKSLDISGVLSGMKTKHKVPVLGLYAGKENQVQIELLNKKGNTVKKISLKITTEKLPKELKKAVIIKKHRKKSAYRLIVASGFDTPYPFAFDERGDIRWYMSGDYDSYGYFPLSNHRFILMDGETCAQTYVKPMSQSVNEMDYMGRVYQTYMVKNGVHHEIIEKTPGGNFLVLTNSNKNHSEDCIEEIDRKTGEVIKTLDMRKIFGKKFMDMVDWAHLNTVSYNEKNHCIIVSVRNCDAVVKLNWDNNRIIWILADKSLYKGTKLSKYVLKAKGDYFQYPYQQHSSYEIRKNLDNNKNTIEIMMFDNHFVSKRPVATFDQKKGSYVTIYSVNEKKKTVEIWKKFKGVKSKVYSNYCFDMEMGRVFYMGGCLKKAWKPGHRKGVIYEFDYASEKTLNTYSLKNTFYRAYQLSMDWELCVEKLPKPKKSVIGNGYTFQEEGRQNIPTAVVTSDKIYCSLIGSFLYVHAQNHQISKIELIGENCYYFRPDAQNGGLDEKYRNVKFSTAVSLEGLPKGIYTVVVTVNNVRQNTKQSIDNR